MFTEVLKSFKFMGFWFSMSYLAISVIAGDPMAGLVAAMMTLTATMAGLAVHLLKKEPKND